METTSYQEISLRNSKIIKHAVRNSFCSAKLEVDLGGGDGITFKVSKSAVMQLLNETLLG